MPPRNFYNFLKSTLQNTMNNYEYECESGAVGKVVKEIIQSIMSKANPENLCKCERPGICVDIYYVDDICIECGGKIRKNFQGDWWKK